MVRWIVTEVRGMRAGLPERNAPVGHAIGWSGNLVCHFEPRSDYTCTWQLRKRDEIERSFVRIRRCSRGSVGGSAPEGPTVHALGVVSDSFIPDAQSMKVLLIRHAQSQNNVAAREERAVVGRSKEETKLAFEKRRVDDPALSELGTRQADALAKYLASDPLLAAHAHEEIVVRCSPMSRTMHTARPFLKAFPRWRGFIDERIFETGGVHSIVDGVERAVCGPTPSELRVIFPEFEPSAYMQARSDVGWYELDHRGKQKPQAFRVRSCHIHLLTIRLGRLACHAECGQRAMMRPPRALARWRAGSVRWARRPRSVSRLRTHLGPASIAEALKCAAFLRSAEDSPLGAARHAQPPKLMVLVVHGDLIDTLLQGLLGSPCRFMHYNTAQSLLECSPDGRWTVYFLNRAEHVGEGMRTGDEMISAAN